MRLSKKRKKLLIKCLYGLIALLALYLFYFFFTYKGFYIEKIEVNNEKYQQSIASSTENELDGSTGYIFPSRHIAFLPTTRIEKRLMLDFPEVKTVMVSRKGFKGVSVKITLRTPSFKMENGLALDQDGVVYKEPGDISSLPLFSFVTVFPDEDQVHNIILFKDKLAVRLGIVEGVHVDANKDVRYNLADSGTYVTTTLESDPNTLWSTLLSAADTEPLATLLQTKRNELEYIDLRFGNKVFYKFLKGNLKDSIATTTPSVLH